MNIKNYKENKCLTNFYFNETFDFENNIEKQKESKIATTDETSNSLSEGGRCGYQYSESEDEIEYVITKRKDKKSRETAESSGPTPNANELSNKNFDERNVLLERLKTNLVEDSLKSSPVSACDHLDPPKLEQKKPASVKSQNSDDHATSNHSVSEFEVTT